MKERAQQLLKMIEDDIDANRLILPSLPEVAFRVREMTGNIECSLPLLEREIAKDAAIAARLLKVANSSALQRGVPVTSLRQAINSLGLNLVRSLVMHLAILQCMQSAQDRQRLRGFVASGLRISTLCHSLSGHHVHLDAELASLGGLLHDIGKLPLRDFLERQPDLDVRDRFKFELILHPHVGAFMLQRWQMADELIQMARLHERILRETGDPLPDYADVVIAANILHYGLERGRFVKYRDIDIPALRKCTSGMGGQAEKNTAEDRMQLALEMIS